MRSRHDAVIGYISQTSLLVVSPHATCAICTLGGGGGGYRGIDKHLLQGGVGILSAPSFSTNMDKHFPELPVIRHVSTLIVAFFYT